MTGYAKTERVLNEYRISCELKALNSRYLNVELSCPSFLSSREIDFTKLVQRYVKRGKVSLKLLVEFLAPPAQALHIDFGLAKLYYDGLEDLVTRLGIPEPVNLDHLLRFRELIRFELPQEQEEQLWETCKKVLEETLQKLDLERMREGKNLSEHLLKIVEDLSQIVENMRQIALQIKPALKEKLSKNVEQLLSNVQIDPALLESIVALNVQKLDVREEIDRLESHLGKARELLDSDDAVGNHLDFLAQEMLRELNTVLSKSEDGRLIELGLRGKVLVSQFREQLQNLE